MMAPRDDVEWCQPAAGRKCRRGAVGHYAFSSRLFAGLFGLRQRFFHRLVDGFLFLQLGFFLVVIEIGIGFGRGLVDGRFHGFSLFLRRHFLLAFIDRPNAGQQGWPETHHPSGPLPEHRR